MSNMLQLLRNRTDAEVALVAQVSDLYDTGRLLWTREILRDIENQLDIHPEYLDVQPFNGGPRVRVPDPRTEEERRTAPRCTNPIVRFLGHRRLIDPMSTNKRLDPGQIYNTYTFRYMACADVDLGRELNPHCAIRDFQHMRDQWQASLKCMELKCVFRNLPIPKGIDKILCLGLGDIQKYDIPRDTICPVPVWNMEGLAEFSPAVQHAAAMTMRDVLAERFGTPDIQLLAQDPIYSQISQTVLTHMGFQIVGRHGAGGFAEIDDNTLVFNYRDVVNNREIIAEIARPAVVITEWDDQGPGSTIDYDRDAIAGYTPDGQPIFRGLRWDYSTPRTLLWQESYKQFAWPECYTTRDPSIRWRGMILVRVDS
ncbi:hypothetical protein F5B20DRAFT_559781 [Whalleya microplaca]|nr:hypothetical protein F5B20DRAFT_559781 [Whalleya microplaca]